MAFVLITVPLFCYQLWDHRLPRPRLWDWLAYGLASVTLASPWFLAVAIADPTFLRYFFWTHHVVRYVTPLDHEQPFWYYAPGLLYGMFPWTILLPGLLVYCWKSRAIGGIRVHRLCSCSPFSGV